MSDFGFCRLACRSLAAAAAIFAAVVGGHPAQAGTNSSIVIDADTGRILAAHDPDAINYPASLTKMMTLYLTFKGLESGKLNLQQRFLVSAHAAAQAPSKLDLKPGESVALHDLIFAVITHSANDAAVVLAENEAGSEPAFALRMNEQAKALGMMHTHFDNASGLPDPNNTTTARDLAMLARGLYRDFPKEYPWFATEDFSFNGVNYANHNHLMHSFRGMDGIKTGYIRASGFNLAASAVRDGHRLVAVVMGGESAHSRDMEMASLLDRAFAANSAPATTEVADDTTAAPAQSTDSGDGIGTAIAALSPVPKAEAATHETPAQERALHRKVARRIDGWSIQVGAYVDRAQAVHAGELALHRLPPAKGRVVEVVAPVHSDKEQVFRARIVHFSQREAEMACRDLHRHHTGCAVIAPGEPQVALN